MNSRKNFGADLKLIVVGNAGTGKTSFVNRWTKNTFNEAYKATIVSEFGYKILMVNDVIYRVQLWDLAGQDKNTCITKIFCRDAHGALIVADCTDKNTLLETEKWKASIDENSKFMDGSDLPAVLIDNKCDLIKDGDNNSVDDLKEFGKKNKFLSAFRTSAKEGVNVKESIEYLINEIIKRLNRLNPDDIKQINLSKTNESIKIERNDNETRPKNNECC
jgi:Ras-related protein Rab-32